MNRPTERRTSMNFELGDIQLQFAQMVWEKEPIGSGELVKLCKERFEWKKSTTYTVLKKLCEKGLLQNNDGVVTSVVSKEEYYSAKSEQFVAETFKGSLPAFIASFASGKKLSKKDVDEIQKMINAFREDCDE